jgi:hypothetical protein
MAILEDQTVEDEVIEREPVKTMAYYEANPGEMPEDIDSINDIPEADGEIVKDDELKSGVKEEEKPVDKEANKGANAEEKGEVDESTRPSILAKNGKDTMPYGVLEGTRNNLNDARSELSTANTRIEELESVVDGLKQDAGKAANAEKELHDGKDAPLTADGKLDVEKLREDYDDDLVDIMIGMHKETQAANEKFDTLSEKFEVVTNKNVESEEAVQRNSVQEAIDSNAFIAEVQAKGGDDWDTAIAIDKSLRMNPLWKESTYAERYEEIAKQMGDKSVATTEGDLDNKVDEALRKAEGKQPTSISDLDGGEHIDVDGIQSGANLSVTQTEARIESMSPEQLDDWLATG